MDERRISLNLCSIYSCSLCSKIATSKCQIVKAIRVIRKVNWSFQEFDLHFRNHI